MPKPIKKNHKKSKFKTKEVKLKEVNEVKQSLEKYGFLDDMEEIAFLYSKLDSYVEKDKKWYGEIPLKRMGRVIIVKLYNVKKKPSVVIMRNDSSI